jgi:Fe-S-cluster containining protein
LQFDTVRVYLRNKRWYMLVNGRCIYLGRDNKCKIYDRRPERCRRHNPPGCERFGRYYDVMLNTPEDLENYLGKEKQQKSLKCRK